MVNKLVFHFHFGVLQPETLVGVVDFQSSLKNRSCSGKLFEVLLPLGVAYPDGQVIALPTKFVLKLTSLLLLVDMKLFFVHDALHGRSQGNGTMDLGIFKDLIGSDLDKGSLLIFDGRRLHLDHSHG